MCDYGFEEESLNCPGKAGNETSQNEENGAERAKRQLSGNNKSSQKDQNRPFSLTNKGKPAIQNQGNTQGSSQSGQTKAQGPKIAENLLQINVFFQTLNVQTVAEEPKYEVSFYAFETSLDGVLI